MIAKAYTPLVHALRTKGDIRSTTIMATLKHHINIQSDKQNCIKVNMHKAGQKRTKPDINVECVGYSDLYSVARHLKRN